jgi:hypothetical protein
MLEPTGSQRSSRGRTMTERERSASLVRAQANGRVAS